MKKNRLILNFIAVTVSLGILSCNSNSGAGCFSTKNDSIEFAKRVLAIYSDTSLPNSPQKPSGPKDVSAFSNTNWAPIPWDTVSAYSAAHDSAPLMAISGTVVKGLLVDATGFSAMRSLPVSIKKIYLRFGRKPNGDYTIMVLPVDASNNVNKGAGLNNYDHLDPCPNVCPNNFQ